MLTHPPDTDAPGASSVLDPPDQDTVVVLRRVTWAVFEGLLKSKGDAPTPRYAYLDGELEIMSPGQTHERTKTNLARLIETYGMLRDVPISGIGSWTLKNRLKKRGVEPDECYFVGRFEGDAPDLALEVVFSNSALNKLPIYASFGVSEVWIWRRGALEISTLHDEGYVVTPRSALLPDLDLTMLTMLAPQVDQHAALQTWMRWLRAGV